MEKNLQMASDFYEEYGRWPKQEEKYKGHNIGIWCTKQRTASKRPHYPPERRIKLESVGFIGAERLTRDKEWQDNFAVLESYAQEYGHLPRQGEIYNGVNIGYWYVKQRQMGQNLPNYPDEYKKKLKSIGVNFAKRKAKVE